MKSEYNKGLITLTVITLSKFHVTRICIKKQTFEKFFSSQSLKAHSGFKTFLFRNKLCRIILNKLCFSEIIRTVITLLSRCYHEHLDLFTEIRRPDVTSLIETPFGGRYCGKIPPRSFS